METIGREMNLRPSKGIDLSRVIGVPHLVGRMFDLYDGILVVPNGESWEKSRITLRADGSIAGSNVRNEGRWAPYEFASDEYVPSAPARSFALMYPDDAPGPYAAAGASSGSAPYPPYAPYASSPSFAPHPHSHPPYGSYSPYPFGSSATVPAYVGVPDSIWRHTRADMPVGYLCGDPEAPSQVCLIPDVPLATNVRVVYLVATCERFYRQTVPSLLDQLLREGIEPERIKVVVNACSKNDRGTIRSKSAGISVSAAFSTHDAWEWTALYEAPLRWPGEFDYAMLIHDTVHLQQGFRRTVEGVNGHLPWDHLPASPMARCLLGLYARTFLERLNPWLRSIDRISKTDGIMAEVAGELLARASTAMSMGAPAEWKEIVYPYNSSVTRRRKEFSGCRIDKFLHAGSNPALL